MRCATVLPAVALALLAAAAPIVAQESPDTDRVTITGRVVDELSRAALEGVTVRIVDLEETLETDSAGEFTLRNVRPGTYELRLRHSGYAPASGSFRIMRSGQFVAALRPLEPGERGATGRFSGRIFDRESGSALVGAEIRLPQLTRSGVTDPAGRFAFDEIPAGRYAVEFSFLGYATVEDTIAIVAGRTSDARVPLPVDPVELPSIDVRVEQRQIVLEKVGFYKRRDEGWGKFIDLETIRAQNPSEMTDLFSGVGGVTLMADKSNALERYIVLRGGLQNTFTGGPCFPIVMLDGTVVHRDHDSPAELDHLVDPSVVAGIEIYPTQTGVPLEYGGTGAACGLIAIWTRT